MAIIIFDCSTMGNSIPKTQSPPKQQQNIVVAVPQVHISVVQDLECRETDAPDPFITNIPEKTGGCSGNELQVGKMLEKPKRQLPPLKKNRSSKKLQMQPISSKENIATASVIKEPGEDKLAEHQTTKSRQKANIFQVCELKQIETDLESNYIQTRAKKMRVSKRISNATIL